MQSCHDPENNVSAFLLKKNSHVKHSIMENVIFLSQISEIKVFPWSVDSFFFLLLLNTGNEMYQTETWFKHLDSEGTFFQTVITFISVAWLSTFLYCIDLFCLFVVVLYIVCPMLPVSLDCPYLIVPSVFSNVYLLCPVSCMPNVACFSGLSILDCSFSFL